MDNHDKIKDFVWSKNWSGKWTILECCYFGKEYTSLLAKIYGVGPTHALFTWEKGSSANFLVPSEVEKFTQILVGDVQKDNRIIFTWVDTIISAANSVLSFVRGFDNTKATKEDFEKLWTLLDEYLLVHFPIKKIVDYLPSELLNTVLPHLEKARVYAEPVYAESLLFVKKFSIDQAPEFGLSPELFLCLTNTELDKVYTDGTLPSRTELESRYQFSLLSFVSGEYTLIASEDAREIVKNVLYKEDKLSSLKGVSAFRGKVKGRVQIVIDPSLQASLPPDTVLVTGMTRPDYIHLFKDAIAVVTDAGGILSHAAITARELQKPTIVGTEIATKVLKDGDMIEVDADTGIVTIMK